jgi:hypothetical protein
MKWIAGGVASDGGVAKDGGGLGAGGAGGQVGGANAAIAAIVVTDGIVDGEGELQLVGGVSQVLSLKTRIVSARSILQLPTSQMIMMQALG